jgi:hypothetical protein
MSMRDGIAEPDADGGSIDGAAVDKAGFAVAGRHGPVLAELVACAPSVS